MSQTKIDTTKIFAWMGRKGGIGKTTGATTLASKLALQGFNTLLVDADGQGNASSTVGIEPYDGFASLVLEDVEWSDVLSLVPESFAGPGLRFDILSAAELQSEVEHADYNLVTQAIYERFQELNGIYDVIVVDTSPSITAIHTAFYYTADYILLPTMNEDDSIGSLARSIAYISKASAQASQQPGAPAVAQILGIVPQKISMRFLADRLMYRHLQQFYGAHYNVLPPVMRRAAWRSARTLTQSIWTAEVPGATAARGEFEPVARLVTSLLNPTQINPAQEVVS
ncbi:ParA family protein [Phototrophicus methaneseepsis]|uniref:ParA family protein n=1 Tax=Phototrophicus methaneseepsis TaxID=2710758 RepID=A0A7S8E5A0_9CHLR|nr:ParA family protein [Phototrophicus methaneseepsis]QPC80619.1 ParA family protein [Phototrophicus methaneseepsis]